MLNLSGMHKCSSVSQICTTATILPLALCNKPSYPRRENREGLPFCDLPSTSGQDVHIDAPLQLQLTGCKSGRPDVQLQLFRVSTGASCQREQKALLPTWAQGVVLGTQRACCKGVQDLVAESPMQARLLCWEAPPRFYSCRRCSRTAWCRLLERCPCLEAPAWQ